MRYFVSFHNTAPSVTVVFLCVPGAVLAALNNVPSNLPSDIVKMDLSKNNIQHLRPKQFLLSKDLKLLNLSSNNLQHIDKGEANAQLSVTTATERRPAFYPTYKQNISYRGKKNTLNNNTQDKESGSFVLTDK